MAQITLHIPPAILSRVVNAIAAGYSATIEDAEGNVLPNPQTKEEFAKAQIIKYIKNQVRRAEQETKNRETESSVETDITIT